jgi:GNAT superfamily N-acetyltransferase
VGARIRPQLYLAEHHVWYERQLSDSQAGVEWPEGLRLVTGTADDFPALHELDTVDAVEAAQRLAAGAQWWLVYDGGQPLFSCWLFTGDAPVLAAPGGRLRLPADTVVLEDSVTAAAARGRGIAPRAWSALATMCATRHERMLTKVAVDNAPSRKAVEKAGFVGVAVMSLRKVGPWRHTTVEQLGGAPGWLAENLGAA